MKIFGRQVLATIVLIYVAQYSAFATDKPTPQEKSTTKKNSDESPKSQASEKGEKARAEVKSEAAAAKKAGSVGEGNAGIERHRDPCTKQPEMPECKLTMPKK